MKFEFICKKLGKKIQSIVTNSNLYARNLARNPICSIKFKFIYDKLDKKFNL